MRQQELELVDEPLNVAWEGYVDISRLVVPCDGDAVVEGTVSVVRNFVHIFERSDEVLGVMLANGFDAKVVDD